MKISRFVSKEMGHMIINIGFALSSVNVCKISYSLIS